MADWDTDSPQLYLNLEGVVQRLVKEAPHRPPLDRETARRWQADTLRGLSTPYPQAIARYRGEPGLETAEVHVAGLFGVPAPAVLAALTEFETRLCRGLELLDQAVPPGQFPDADQIGTILSLCAWAHAEWVRIHPFGNGNGRTARLWVNCIALRYGLPPFLVIRPRPGGDYALAGTAAMHGDWRDTVPVLRRELLRHLGLPVS